MHVDPENDKKRRKIGKGNWIFSMELLEKYH